MRKIGKFSANFFFFFVIDVIVGATLHVTSTDKALSVIYGN